MNIKEKVMARPKKTTVVEETTNVNDELLKKLEEMQKQLADLKAENESLKTKQVEDKTEDEEEINGDTEVVVISQFMGKLVISTEGNGIGTVYRFEEFGDVQDIPFSDLKEIVKNKPNFAKEGLFYIANDKAVKKLRLTKEYEHIINNDLFAHLLDEKSDVIIKAYKDAPKLQQEQIVAMIDERLAANKDVDGNVLVKIGKLCGRDFLRVTEDDE
jgi:hypothetical protein